MAREFQPPHVLDDTPIPLPAEVVCRDIVRQLRAAAEWFRRSADVPIREAWERYEHVGRLLIEAHRYELIPASLPQVRELTEWHTARPRARQRRSVGGRAGGYVRCPGGLFCDLRGGDRVVDSDHPEMRHGPGVVTRSLVGFDSLPHHEQEASTCEVLADLLDLRPGNRGGGKAGRTGRATSTRAVDLDRLQRLIVALHQPGASNRETADRASRHQDIKRRAKALGRMTITEGFVQSCRTSQREKAKRLAAKRET